MTTPPLVVPVAPVPAQRVEVALGGQACRIKLYTRHVQVPVQPSRGIVTNPPIFAPIDPIYLDLEVGDVPVIGGVLCLNNTLVVRSAYLGFVGDLSVSDTQSNDDPRVVGLGSRWLLLYWPP